MPELTPFNEEVAPTVEFAPLRIRRVEMESEWVLEEEGKPIGRLLKTSGVLSSTEEHEFRTDSGLWTFRQKFWTLPLGPVDIYRGGEKIGHVKPSKKDHTGGRVGVLELEGRQVSCREAGLRFDVESEGDRLYQIELPWQDSSIKQKVSYHLWPEPGLDMFRDALPLIMPLFWLGRHEHAPYQSDFG